MVANINKNYPPVQEGEASGRMLSETHVGGNRLIAKELVELRQRFIDFITEESKINEEQATKFVDKHLIGMRKPVNGPSTLYATPIAQEIWKAAYNRKTLEEAAPIAKDTEHHSEKLKELYGGDSALIKREITALRKALIEDIMEGTKMDREEATANVDAFLVGFRRPPKSRETLHTTEEGERLWSEKYDRQKKDTTPQTQR